MVDASVILVALTSAAASALGNASASGLKTSSPRSHGVARARIAGIDVQFKKLLGMVMTSIYVGNLPFSATEDQVRDLFASFGQITSVKLPTDRETGRPRGFAFVEMSSSDAQKAIEGVNGKNLGGRALRVNEAQERGAGGGRGGPPRRGNY